MPKPHYKSYIICTSPRSGSTLLRKLLAATGKSGNPNSHFHVPSLTGWLESYDLQRTDFGSDHETLSAIFAAAQKRGTGDTGMFGLRLQRGSFDFLMQQMEILYPDQQSDFARIQTAFGPTLLIHLTRANKLDQAISRVKATQTGLWHKAADGSELERLSPPQEPYYDAGEITRTLAELSALEDAWTVWFERENLQPLIVSYDALSSDPANVLAGILEELGLDPDLARDVSPQVAKLADATNRDWAKRFLAEQGDRLP